MSRPDAHDEVFRHERRIWMLINLLVFLAAVLAMWSLWMRGRELEQLRADAGRKETAYQARVDSLEAVLAQSRVSGTDRTGLDGLTTDNFHRLGLDDPLSDIRASLLARPDLLPALDVGGPPPRFGPVHVLNDRWALAYFGNGRGSGRALFEYTVQAGGRIDWKVLVRQLD